MRLNLSLSIVCAFVAMLLLASCHSSKHVAKTPPTQPTIVTQPTVTPDTPGNSASTFTPPTDPNFTAKVKVTLRRGDDEITAPGMLRMRYNDVIQLTLSDPLLGITEVGRMELSTDSMLIIDRFNKRYVSAQYSDIEPLRNKNIDFSVIQTTFWDEARKSDSFSFDIPLKSPVTLQLRLSDKGNSDKWEGHTTVSSKYIKTDAEILLNNLVK